ncbi:MAG: YihY/virulence factor BrkB family protein [Deltaproteobacteria bacterium]|nr:MAG: YihY/virulence factor BrkB family protein [Deltaproteobacteria bacterium]TMA47698.1 MAG: YihY/virulence factor BrkB family protein [Deltaproteobacteria bacterium]TMA70788.1 MAG: YihY/virulence factor BrkB family protein [Deltaproteobacteria bacterium]TMB17856.1 MAG: YihY/virulence factor BrkB family protein [Deltaproteobacteria bacterium]
MRQSRILDFLREVAREWRDDDALIQGAALAYYALFAMAPLLVLIIAVAGMVIGRTAAQGRLVEQIQDLMGPEGARMVEGMIEHVSSPASGIAATLGSLATILLGASGVVGQLRTSLNRIWGVRATQGGVRGMMRQRLAALGLIVGIGVLMLVSVTLSAVLSAVREVLATHVPLLSRLLPAANFALSFLLATALFGMIYRVLPDVDLGWGDVILGAAVTALLFTIGKSLVGLYLGRAGVTSVYGAAGTLVFVLLWVYYSAQILLLGAEFTEVYSRRYGSRRALSPAPSPP